MNLLLSKVWKQSLRFSARNNVVCITASEMRCPFLRIV